MGSNCWRVLWGSIPVGRVEEKGLTEGEAAVWRSPSGSSGAGMARHEAREPGRISPRGPVLSCELFREGRSSGSF